MDKWIRDLIAAGVAGVQKLAKATWERLAWLYNLIVTIGLNVKNAWATLLNGVRYSTDRIRNTIREAYVTVYWLKNIWLPKVIGNAVNALSSVLMRLISETRKLAELGINVVRQWVQTLINGVVGTISNVIRWATREIAQLIDTVSKVAALVFMLLTSPSRMAKWLLAALVTEGVKYVDEHAESLFAWARSRSIQYTLRAATRIEEVLSRLL